MVRTDHGTAWPSAGRRAAAVAGAVAAALTLAACDTEEKSGSGNSASEKPAAASAPAPTKLVQSGALTVCVDATYPPLEYQGSGGEYKGFDVGVATAVAKMWKLKPVFKNTAFTGILPALSSGRCDLAWSGLFVNPDRVKSYAAVPYQRSTSVLLVKHGNPKNIHGPDDLVGKTVVSENGTDLLKSAEKIKKQMAQEGKGTVTVQGYDKFDQAVQQLAIGRADAVVDQDIDASYRNLKQPGQFQAVYSFPDVQTFAAYYKPDNTDLGTKLAKALAALQKTGDLVKIAKAEGMPSDRIQPGQPVGKGTSNPDGT